MRIMMVPWPASASRGDQPHHVDRGDEKPRGDTDGFLGVVVDVFRAVGGDSIGLSEHHDQPRRVSEVRLVLVRAERRQGAQPLVWHAPMVVLVFFPLGRLSNALLQRGIRHRDKRPRLLMGATRCGPGGPDGQLDGLTRYRRG
jgi:hypothetical protein